MTGANSALTLHARAIGLIIAAQFTLPAAAQGDWIRISPVKRGDAVGIDSAAAASGAIRLIIEYDAEHVRVVQQTPVDIAPSTLSVTNDESVGIFVEVRDAANRRLARVPAPQTFSSSLEIFPERHDQPIVRTDAPRATGAFTVVVPVTAAADHVTIVSIAARSSEDGSAGFRTTDLASFPLKVP